MHFQIDEDTHFATLLVGDILNSAHDSLSTTAGPTRTTRYGVARRAVFVMHCPWVSPNRTIPDGPVAVSPADGKVVAIIGDGAECTRISIFLNILNVHVNRAPIAGRIADV
jgi:phosphatidylserine decarboxylase